MHIVLTNEDIKQILLSCFTDGGLELLSNCGVYIRYSGEDYQAARKALDAPCLEDVFVQMVMEKRRVYFIETEDGENNEVELTLENILENWKSPEIQDDIQEIKNGHADAIPCYRVLQYALYDEVKWG